MSTKHPKSSSRLTGKPAVSLAAIRRYARQIAERFHPDKIILFGSYAYGTPRRDSDVDLLVVMAARNQLDQAAGIRLALPAPFPMDLIVRTPHDLKWRLAEGESFSTEVNSGGRLVGPVAFCSTAIGASACSTRPRPRGRSYLPVIMTRDGPSQLPIGGPGQRQPRRFPVTGPGLKGFICMATRLSSSTWCTASRSSTTLD